MLETYFAAEPYYSDEYLNACLDKIDTYRNYCKDRGLIDLWQRALKNYYGVSADGMKLSSQVSRSGDEGEQLTIKINDYRNLIQHQLILITSQRPAGQCKAINSDSKSLHEARIGSMLTEYYLSQIGWEEKFIRQAEGAIVLGECFNVLDWDATAGEPVAGDIETEETVMTGDSTLRVIYPWYMARDPYASSSEDGLWNIYTFKVNKFELAKKFPEHAEKILSASTRKLESLSFVDSVGSGDDDTDFIDVHCAVHKKCNSVKPGRYSWLIPDAILLDGPFPYPEYNVNRMRQSEMIESAFSYTNNNDLLAIEEVTDALNSIIVSNQLTFGNQNIIGVKGANFDHKALAKGFNYFEVEPQYFDKIKSLDLVRTAPEIFKYEQDLQRKKQTLAGIDPISRGDLEGGLRSSSGSAMALIQAQSLQFNSGGQRSYYQTLSKTNTSHIRILQKFAHSPKIIQIVGKDQGQYIEEFSYSKDNLQNISTIVFEPVDAAMQTIGGKVNIADNLLSKNMIKNAQQYVTVVRTGNLDALTQGDESLQTAQITENEWLRNGKPVRAVVTEMHEEHMKSHQSVIASPESKQDEEMVARVTAHIQEHSDMWNQLSQTNPALLIATGQKVLPPPPPPPGMMPPPGMPPMPQGHGPSGGPNVPVTHGQANAMPKMLEDKTNFQQKAENINAPKLPVNPLTHERATVPGAQ